MTIFRAAVIGLLFLLASIAHAANGVLYRCAGANAAVSIQSEPCPQGTTQVWKHDTIPDPALTSEQLAAAEARRQKDTEAARTLSLMAGTTRETPPVPVAPPPPVIATPVIAEPPKGPCRTAHELADSIRDKPWLEMTDNQLRRLDDWIAQQCADPPTDR